MGCGKSSVGRKLSELLCCRFMDLDDCIVEKAGCSIPEIFAEKGEAEFRKIEQETLKSIVGMSEVDLEAVLALGGGAVMTAGSEEIVHEGTMCIYLKASVDTLLEHLSGKTASRPMLNQQPIVTGENSSAMSGDNLSLMPTSSPSAMSGDNSSLMPTSSPSVMSGDNLSLMPTSSPSVMSSEVETSPLRARILELMSKRAATYERTAHLIIDTDGKSVDEVAAMIVRKISAYQKQ